jgi:hypothetical protein
MNINERHIELIYHDVLNPGINDRQFIIYNKKYQSYAPEIGIDEFFP